jgi:protein FrlC
MAYPTIRSDQPAGMNIHWANYSLDAFLDAQERIGFKTIELWACEPHFWIDHMRAHDVDVVRRKVEAHGLAVHVLTPENCIYPYQVGACEPEHVERSFGYFANGIRAAAALGCDCMEINSGWGYWNEDREEAWKRSRDMLARLADVAGQEGIVLALETLRPQESQLVVKLEDEKRMLEEVGSPNLKPMVDTVAMSVAGETLDQWFDSFGTDIWNMHFVDCNPYGHLIWGDGDRSMFDWMGSLERHGYSRWLGQEITDGRYMDDPYTADLRNFHNFERYFEEDV